MSHFFLILLGIFSKFALKNNILQVGKGRSTSLIEARDNKLFERYYFWTEVKRLRFDDALRKLSEEEFFISESRVMQIIRQALRDGKTVDGKCIERPLFCGFRVSAPRSAKSSGVQLELPLFP